MLWRQKSSCRKPQTGRSLPLAARPGGENCDDADQARLARTHRDHRRGRGDLSRHGGDGPAIPTPAGAENFALPRRAAAAARWSSSAPASPGWFRPMSWARRLEGHGAGGAQSHRRPRLDDPRRRPDRPDRSARSDRHFSTRAIFQRGSGAHSEHAPRDPRLCPPLRRQARDVRQRQPQRRLGFRRQGPSRAAHGQRHARPHRRAARQGDRPARARPGACRRTSSAMSGSSSASTASSTTRAATPRRARPAIRSRAAATTRRRFRCRRCRLQELAAVARRSALPYVFEIIWDMQATMLQPVGGMDRIAHAIYEQVRPAVRLRTAGHRDPPRRRPRADRAWPGQAGRPKPIIASARCRCRSWRESRAISRRPRRPRSPAAPPYLPSVKLAFEAPRFWERTTNFRRPRLDRPANENVIYPSHGIGAAEGRARRRLFRGLDQPGQSRALRQPSATRSASGSAAESIEALHPGKSHLLGKGGDRRLGPDAIFGRRRRAVARFRSAARRRRAAARAMPNC